MQVIVITIGSYPYGGAATNRHLSYLKGLVDLGINVKLVILQPDNQQSKFSNLSSGHFNGINFIYAIWYNKPLNSIIEKIFYRIRAHINAIKKINQEIKLYKTDSKIIILLTNPFDILPYLFIAKKNKISCFHERTEYPFLGANSIIKKIILNIYLTKIVSKFDGIYLISNALIKYFSGYIKDTGRILHLPMTVEFERFNLEKKLNNKYGKYIAYCGSMYTDKDGVPDLIKAFNIFARNNTNTNLLLIGDNSDKEKFKLINDLINSSIYKDRIFVTGWIERDQMPELLINAQILALARPDNIQAKGGFPTKLGEYLATGNPVVITDVGEHKDYLKDGVSAFISEPDNPFLFAEKLSEAINNPQKASLIGKEGKKIALQHFNYQIQSKKLLQFINSSI
ncbi:MAG: glycosyltransferase [Bacteroidetes bacterium]|nr:glycosyltransferase [Bacteroidota bacterium]